MAISVNWPTGIISVPKADTVLFGTDPVTGREIRTFDTEQFHKDLRAIEETDAGRPGFPITHSYDSETIIDGVSYAAKMIISSYYTVEFEDGQYRVILQNTNNNVATVAVVNQVSIQPSNSAGLIGSEQIRNLSYTDDTVYINTRGKGSPGTAWPMGAPTNPVDNFADAYLIASVRNYDKYHLDGNLTLTGTDDVTETSWTGDTPLTTLLTFASNDIDGLTASRMFVTGTMAPSGATAQATLFECGLNALTGFSGSAKECGLDGTITLYNTTDTTVKISFLDAFSYLAGSGKPIVDCNNTQASIQFRRFSGGLELRNITNANCNVSVDGDVRLTIHSSCTAGTIVVGPGVDVVDDSSAGTTVTYNTNTADQLEQAVTQSRVAADQATQANQKL